MNEPVELVSSMTDEEAEEIMRRDIVTLLSMDPHCPVAQLLGQAMTDLYQDSLKR